MPQSLSQSVYALLRLIQAMLNMSTLSTNDQGKSFWELVCGSVNQVLADHCRWCQLWRSPFPITLQRIFNTRLKKLSLVVFCCNFWTLQQKKHDYICSGTKIWYLKNVQFLLGHPVFCVVCFFWVVFSFCIVCHLSYGLYFPECIANMNGTV